MNYRSVTFPDRQGGFSLIIAVFIIVVMSLLAVAMLRMSDTDRQASTTDLLSLRAFYAAESAAQYGMNQIFLNLEDCSTMGAPPAAANGAYQHELMRQCTVISLACTNTRLVAKDGVTMDYYQLESTAECASLDPLADDTFRVQRIVEVEGMLSLEDALEDCTQKQLGNSGNVSKKCQP